MQSSTAPRARPRAERRTRQAREEQLLRLAEELFAQHGYAGLTMNALAARAGVTKPVIYDTVGNKDELYRRCFERAANELAAAVTAAAATHPAELEEMLRAGQLAFFGFIQSHAGAWRMLFIDSAAAPHAEQVARVRAQQDHLVAGMLSELARSSERKLEPRAADLVARAVNGAAESLAHWWTEHPKATAEELTDSVCALLLPGLRQFIEAR
jgi:AcrR family transcriptional regulator